MRNSIPVLVMCGAFIQCGLQSLTPSLYMEHKIGGKIIEKIDTGVLKALIIDDSIKIGGEQVYQKNGVAIAYSGSSGGGYKLVINDGRFNDEFLVSRKGFITTGIVRWRKDGREPLVISEYQYYPSGILKSTSMREKFRNKQHRPYDNYFNDDYIDIGKSEEYNEDGVLISYVNYDKEFVFALDDVLKMHSINKLDTLTYYVWVKKIFVNHPFNPSDAQDRLLKSIWYSEFRFQYPYWEVKLYNRKSRDTNINIVDGKTGTVIYKQKVNMRITE